MATSQTPQLDAKLLLGISPAQGLHTKLLLEDNFSRLRSLSSSVALHQQLLDLAYTTLLSWAVHVARVLDDGFHEH
jgi:hypothetical protein